MLKKQILWLHKWLGLLSGIVVFFISISGCIYTFQDELKLWLSPEKYYVTEQPAANQQPLPLSELTQRAQKAINADVAVSRVDLYPDKNRTWVFRAVKSNPGAFGYWNEFQFYKRAFVNPYTGEVQVVENARTEFFQMLVQFHMNLLLGKKVGHALVAYSTAIFGILLLSGLILWMPKRWTKRNVKRSISLDFNVKWKRLNYDLHNILGLYSILFALLFVVTGLVFAFPGFKEKYTQFFNAVSTEKKYEQQAIPNIEQTLPNGLDNGLYFALNQHSNAGMLSIRLKKGENVADQIQVRLSKDKNGDFVWYDINKNSGQIEKIKRSAELNLGEKMVGKNYDLHVGTYGGLFTKILACIASLICASLPVTGCIIWLNKSKKKKRKSA